MKLNTKDVLGNRVMGLRKGMGTVRIHAVKIA